MRSPFIKPIGYGIGASSLLLGVYIVLVGAISGWSYALSQFAAYWYFLVMLAIGFGTQIGLYQYLKARMQKNNIGGVLAVTGTTSTASMLSCCAHYLVNLIPILGVTGLASFVSQYQVELFGVGLLANALGIIVLSQRIWQLKKHEKILGI